MAGFLYALDGLSKSLNHHRGHSHHRRHHHNSDFANPMLILSPIMSIINDDGRSHIRHHKHHKHRGDYSTNRNWITDPKPMPELIMEKHPVEFIWEDKKDHISSFETVESRHHSPHFEYHLPSIRSPQLFPLPQYQPQPKCETKLIGSRFTLTFENPGQPIRFRPQPQAGQTLIISIPIKSLALPHSLCPKAVAAASLLF